MKLTCYGFIYESFRRTTYKRPSIKFIIFKNVSEQNLTCLYGLKGGKNYVSLIYIHKQYFALL